MDSNKEEARKSIEIAEWKLSEKDYDGAKEYVIMAKNMYPGVDGLQQLLTLIEVYKCASEGHWYEILDIGKSADDDTLKKQYKNLALLLHPDKNKFDGAEGAFKLVLEAWHKLSNGIVRTCYERRRKEKEEKTAWEEKNVKAKAAWDEKMAVFKRHKSGLKKSQNQRKPSEGDKRAFMYSSKPRKGDKINSFF